MQRVEYGKEKLEGNGGLTNCESSEDPHQPKKGHHSNNANHQFNNCLSLCFIFIAKLLPTVLDEYSCYYHENSSIEEHDGKDGSQEGTKKNTRLTNEAAGEKKVKYELLNVR